MLQAQPAESETALSFSALGDLLDPVLDEALAPLAAGQRSSARARTRSRGGRGPGAGCTRRRGRAPQRATRPRKHPRPSRRRSTTCSGSTRPPLAALAYAARTTEGPSASASCLARRAGLESSLLDELRRDAGKSLQRPRRRAARSSFALHQVVQAHLGVALPRPLLAEVHQASGGNPFYALEIVRTLARSGVSVEAGKPLPVPDSLHELVHGRLLALATRESATSWSPLPRMRIRPISITETASGVSERRGLMPALEARIVETRGRPDPFHPSAARRRRATRRRIRSVVRRSTRASPSCSRIPKRARGSWPRPLTSRTRLSRRLSRTPRSTRALRGAPRPAALLLERAEQLTPPVTGRDAVRRAVSRPLTCTSSPVTRDGPRQSCAT